MTQQNMTVPQALQFVQQQMNAGQFDVVKNICSQILQQQQSTEAMFFLAIALHQQGHLDAALEWYNKLLNIQPQHDAALSNLGLIFLNKKQYKSAIDVLEKAHQLKRSNLATCFNLANAYGDYGELDKAIKLYRKVIKKDSSNTDVIFNLAKTHAQAGNKKEASQLYERLLRLKPEHIRANYNYHALLVADEKISQAEKCLIPLTCQNNDFKILAEYFLAWLYQVQNKSEDAENLIQNVAAAGEDYSHFVDAWEYANQHFSEKTRYMTYSFDVLEYAISKVSLEGLNLEFGVRFAASTNFIGKRIKGRLFGFDSFAGLPEHWNETAGKGDYSTDGVLPTVQSNTQLIDGWFDKTLPDFVAQHKEPVAFMNVDCDLYSSTKTIFKYLGDQIVSGTIIVFDEYISTSSWRSDEYKAFQELVEEKQLQYEYLVFSPYSRQAVVKIL